MTRRTVDLHYAEIFALHLIELHLAAGHHGHSDAKRAILHARVLLAQLESRSSPVVAHNALGHLGRSHGWWSRSVALWRR